MIETLTARRLAIVALGIAILLRAYLATAQAPQSANANSSAGASTLVASKFPRELVEWAPRSGNPVFRAAGPGHWDAKIRERGWILRDGGLFHLWYTGYDDARDGIKRLGHATSLDGIHWKRSPKNPLCRDHWVEDMMVVPCGGKYYMFAEGEQNDYSVMLTSRDGRNWKWEGPLDIRLADGKTPVTDPRGTPTVWFEHGKWYLFYEKFDKGVWLATTCDVRSRVWVNVQDEPVLVPGPADYDKDMIALNQIIRHGGAYYVFYHGSPGHAEPRQWNTNIARSKDFVHWEKYPGNPLIEDNKSSGIVVRRGDAYWMYTMHNQVDVFVPRRRMTAGRN
jgi:sucrose-6-phosphate hydrolase SacC (GH32 family)